jgi:ABC-2 type transport system ATP-binding protein
MADLAAPSIVQTRGLRKEYGATVALDGVDLSVPRGSVYGLVGPNGAGKTTLLGILGGLRRATAGTVVLDVDRRRMAVLPDTPEFEPWMRAREVVDLSRILVAPEVPPERTDQALAEMGLSAAAHLSVGGFSRGMLQRLGLAATVVTEPDLLVLDEPTSALDPAGRREVLDLVSRLAARSTVLLSSHILGDVQRVCDWVGILREGRLLYQGSMDGLLSGRLTPAYLVRVRPPTDPVKAALAREPWVVEVGDEPQDGWLRVRVRSLEEAEARLAPALAAAGARVVAMEPEQVDLETAFLELTS